MTQQGPRLITKQHAIGQDFVHDPTGDKDTGDHAPDPKAIHDMQLEVALYIESITSELRLMSRAADLEALSYFLEMARIEASIQVEQRALRLT